MADLITPNFIADKTTRSAAQGWHNRGVLVGFWWGNEGDFIHGENNGEYGVFYVSKTVGQDDALVDAGYRVARYDD